jgi:hypothetical protein
VVPTGAAFSIVNSTVTVTGGTLSALSGSGLVRTATFTPTPGSAGTASIGIGNGQFQDAAGNTNTTAASIELDYDTERPTVVLSSNLSTLKAGATASVSFEFNKAPGASFGLDDVQQVGGSLSNFQGSGTLYTATFTPNANASTHGYQHPLTIPIAPSPLPNPTRQIRNCDVVARRTNADEHDIDDLTAFNTDGYDVSGKNMYDALVQQSTRAAEARV